MGRGVRIGGVVLAAGAGRRMGGPKAELRLGGARLVDRAVELLGQAGCDPICAVVRAGTSAGAALNIVNDDPDRGMRSSLDLGVATVEAMSPVGTVGAVDAVAVILVDTPGLTVDGVGAVLDAWRSGRIAVARYGERRGHPTVMSVDLWRRALSLAGPDEGARALLAAEPGLVDQIPVSGDPADLDTQQDVADWVSRSDSEP